MTDCDDFDEREDEIERRGDGTFAPGQSGNIRGRPADEERLGVVKLARRYTKAALAELERIMREGRSEGARVRAADALLSWAWGRPRQTLDVERMGDDRPPSVRIEFVKPAGVEFAPLAAGEDETLRLPKRTQDGETVTWLD